MLTEKFEPYGESLPVLGAGEPEPSSATSTILSVLGQSIFWLLVIAIVFTRVMFFSSAPAFSGQAFSKQASVTIARQ